MAYHKGWRQIKDDARGPNKLQYLMCFYQGNLKGESVVAAILLSRMEASYCTSGFFRS